MALSVGGLGSNLPVDDLVSKLMSIERQPLDKLTQKEVALNAKVASLAQVKGALASFQGAVKSLNDASRFSSVSVSSADNTVVSASSTSSKLNASSYAVEVTQLAQSQRLVTKSGYASTGTVVGGGSLTFNFGEQVGATFVDNPNKSARSVAIPANATLSDIRDAVNKANIGVTANIVNDGVNGNRLVYSVADTGVQNSLKITASGDGGALANLTYDPADGGAAKMTQLQAASNAKFTLDGIEVQKAGNTISDAVEGLTFTLKKLGTTSVSVSKDSGTAQKNIEGFVKAYNDLNKTLNDVSAVSTEAPKPGEARKTQPLTNEFVIRSIKNSLRGSFNTVASGLTGSVKLPSDVGISFSVTGELKLDSTKLQKALTDDPQGVAALFGATGKPTDSQVGFLSATSNTKVGNYDLNITAMNYGVVEGSAVTYSPAVAVGAFDVVVDGVAKSVSAPAGSPFSSATAAAANLQTSINRAYMGVNSSGLTVPLLVGANSFTLSIDGISKTGLSVPEQTYNTAAELQTAMQSSLDAAFGAGKAVVEESGGQLRILSAGNSSTSAVSLGAGLEFAGFSSGQTDAGRPSVMVSVNQSTGALQIASGKKGTSSSVTVSSGLSALGLADGLTNTGKASVEGTLGGHAVTSVGTRLTGDVGTPIEGLTVDVTGGATGARGSVNFTRGFAWALDQALTDLQSVYGPIASRQQGLNTTLKQLSQQKVAISRRLEDTEVRLRKQFNVMDEAVGKLTAMGNYLTQQIQSLQKSV